MLSRVGTDAEETNPGIISSCPHKGRWCSKQDEKWHPRLALGWAAGTLGQTLSSLQAQAPSCRFHLSIVRSTATTAESHLCLTQNARHLCPPGSRGPACPLSASMSLCALRQSPRLSIHPRSRAMALPLSLAHRPPVSEQARPAEASQRCLGCRLGAGDGERL